jgi:hypothetical protein
MSASTVPSGGEPLTLAGWSGPSPTEIDSELVGQPVTIPALNPLDVMV